MKDIPNSENYKDFIENKKEVEERLRLEKLKELVLNVARESLTSVKTHGNGYPYCYHVTWVRKHDVVGNPRVTYDGFGDLSEVLEETNAKLNEFGWELSQEMHTFLFSKSFLHTVRKVV